MNFGKRGEEELYNIGSDPECMYNLAENTEYKSIIKELKDQLVKELTEQGDPRIAGNGAIFDSYPYAEERMRNFYDRYLRGEIWRKDAGWVDSTDFDTMTKK
jgi:hypothetical protein